MTDFNLRDSDCPFLKQDRRTSEGRVSEIANLGSQDPEDALTIGQ